MDTYSIDQRKATYVRAIFQKVAANYDRMNTLMTVGQDRFWRSEVIKMAGLQGGIRLLDLGSGTGDLARMAVKAEPRIEIVAADISMEMMLTGRRKGNLPFVMADAGQTPFSSGYFDVVISGWLVRNVVNLDGVLAEQYRLLKPGGRIIILDTTRPTRNLLTPFVWLHMHMVIPLLGRMFSRNPEAYQYLQSSSESFLLAEDLAGKMEKAGFREVGFKRYMAGTIAIHWGEKWLL
jgi:demethylmenaquinone methyltransferase/2-methoxy-6-polyprenyl-1,4-benzoquinol methylase